VTKDTWQHVPTLVGLLSPLTNTHNVVFPILHQCLVQRESIPNSDSLCITNIARLQGKQVKQLLIIRFLLCSFAGTFLNGREQSFLFVCLFPFDLGKSWTGTECIAFFLFVCFVGLWCLACVRVGPECKSNRYSCCFYSVFLVFFSF
jgi:hypothetical protein